MKVPNIKNEGDQVEELPLGAIPVNPNNLKNGKYSTKYIIEDDKNIQKDVI